MNNEKEGSDYGQTLKNIQTKKPNEVKPGFDSYGFFQQRNIQRERLFWFAMIMSSGSLLLLFVLVFWQGIIRSNGQSEFELISDRGLELFAVAVFGQVFGVVYKIASSVWSNHEFSLLVKGNNNDE